jgi:hypothetical protein
MMPLFAIRLFAKQLLALNKILTKIKAYFDYILKDGLVGGVGYVSSMWKE